MYLKQYFLLVELYDKNLRFLDKILSPLYKLMAYIAASISNFLDLKEFDRKGKNLMEVSPKSII
mgnify:CR=1 FL=1